MKIVNKQKKAFDQDGYLCLPAFFDEQKLAEIWIALGRVIENVNDYRVEEVYYEDKQDQDSLKQIQHLEEKDDFFNELIATGDLYTLAQSLLQEKPIPKNLQYFNKPAQIGKATPAHQDGYYFMLKPCKAVTMWLALEDVDESNGCINYVQGSHKLGLRRHSRTNTLGFSQGITNFPSAEDQKKMIKVSARPGDLLAHDAATIHSADANQSLKTRKALGFIYYASSAKTDTDQYDEYQKNLAKSLREENKI